MTVSAQGAAFSPDGVSYGRLLWISACLALALAPRLATLPIWVSITVGACIAVRLYSAAHARRAPARPLRLTISVAAIALLFLQLRTFNGLAAGTALLSLVAGLKLLETQRHRDLHVITLIIYFLSLATLLGVDSFWLFAYLILVCWLTTSTLLRLTNPVSIEWRASLRYAGRILAQALPLALVFWLFFPRFAGPLWQLPDEGGSAVTGLGDSMSPGDITELARSDEIALRVHFSGATPPANERYYRGPVLHQFDGHEWRRSDADPIRASALLAHGTAYRYTMSLEPNPHHWIFALDWPALWDLPRAFLTSDYMLAQPGALLQRVDFVATSYTQVDPSEPLGPALRQRDLELPRNRNARTLGLARQLRLAHSDDRDYVRAVLEMFRQQPFFYTLNPPKLGNDSVDAFLFDTKRGFCGHYASAFANLMRAAGIPAHVVTGYQGGTYNRYADYWILRQSDAHAWDEIWLEGRGWQRIDPTSWVAPARVERGLDEGVTARQFSTSRWQVRTPWFADLRLRLDALRQVWRERILEFNQDSQERLLAWMRIPEPDGQKLVLVLSAGLALSLLWLTWQVRRELDPRRADPLLRAYARFCARLAAVGLPRRNFEGAEDYAARVSASRPDLAGPVAALCRHYTALRYGGGAGSAAADSAASGSVAPGSAAPGSAASRSAALKAFISAVRAFRPSR